MIGESNETIKIVAGMNGLILGKRQVFTAVTSPVTQLNNYIN
jgi:hypothetical protein